MRHPRATAHPIGPLAIAMVEAALGALLVPVSGGAETPGAARVTTRETAVRVAAVAAATQEEGLVTEAAGPDPQDLHGPLGPAMSGRHWSSRSA